MHILIVDAPPPPSPNRTVILSCTIPPLPLLRSRFTEALWHTTLPFFRILTVMFSVPYVHTVYMSFTYCTTFQYMCAAVQEFVADAAQSAETAYTTNTRHDQHRKCAAA
jgi:hypothetical protein